ncbi:MAG TPA: hypothetical protein VGM15_03705 [Burkholderiaceae bacterium]|jgi:hypothetical protein
MKKRGPFSGFEGAALGAISIVALIIATVITFTFEGGAPEDGANPPAQIAGG